MFHKSTTAAQDAVEGAVNAGFGVAVYENTDRNPQGSWTLSIVVPKAQYVDDTGWVVMVLDNGDLIVPLNSLADTKTILSHEEVFGEVKPELKEKAPTASPLKPLLDKLDELIEKAKQAAAHKNADKVPSIVMMTENGVAIDKGAAVKTLLSGANWASITEDAHAMLHGYASKETNAAMGKFVAAIAMAAVTDGAAEAKDVLPNLACFAEDDGNGNMSFAVGGGN